MKEKFHVIWVIQFLKFNWDLTNTIKFYGWSPGTIQPLHQVCQKYVGKCKGGVKMDISVLNMHITCKHKCDQNVCELWFMECMLFHY